MKNIVKYDNKLNQLILSGFTAREQEFFFTICMHLRDTGSDLISLTFEEIRREISYTDHDNRRMAEDLDSMNKKLMALNFRVINLEEKSIERTHFFESFKVFYEANYMVVRLNKQYQALLNDLTQNYSKWELCVFTRLTSKYSKTLYRLLKQWRTIGKKAYGADELNQLLDVPTARTYTHRIIVHQIIEPAVKDLQREAFKTLEMKVLRERKRGRPIIGYEFTWTPEDPDERPEVKRKTKKSKSSGLNNADMAGVDCNAIAARKAAGRKKLETAMDPDGQLVIMPEPETDMQQIVDEVEPKKKTKTRKKKADPGKAEPDLFDLFPDFMQ